MDDTEHEMRRRLAIAYATALEGTHSRGRVEIHIGSGVAEYLQSLCTIPIEASWLPRQMAWGFPVVTPENVPADHLSVHVVYDVAVTPR